MRPAVAAAHRQLIDQLIARGALWSPRLIEAFRATPRHLFLDRVYHYRRQGGWREVRTRALGRAELRLLYSDRALTTRLSEATPDRPAVPISSSSQPSLMAQMLEDLRLEPGQRALEVGAGTGYNAALLARLVRSVVSVEVDRRVLAEAREHLRALPDRRVHFCHGDGRDGCPEGAPFDRIEVTAATPDLEPAWLDQLSPGGLLLAPLELAPGLAYLVCGGAGPTRSGEGGGFEGRLTRPAYFMPLRAENESGRAPAGGPGALPDPEGLSAVAAPWASWSERRPVPGGPGFLPALAFLGWLEGLTVSYLNLPDGHPGYGVGDPERGHGCWLGDRLWHVTGTAGRDLGERLWQTFLEAGGPWPTEFRLRAYPPGRPEPPASEARPAIEEPASPAGEAGSTLEKRASPAADGEPAGLCYRRQGPRCTQVWELIGPRCRGGWD
jgi:protein-L-isoaspartate O-methyltransferase